MDIRFITCSTFLLTLLLCISKTSGEEQRCTTVVSERIDCYPEGGEEERRCASRGCCWDDSAGEGPPKCYFPSNYGYEAVNEPERRGNSWEIRLRRIDSPSMFGGDAEDVAVLVQEQTNNRIRIKIYDPNRSRFEVPYIKIEGEDVQSPSYDIEFQNSPFSIKITRKSTGNIIFDSSIGPLIFADQFLQWTTRLGSPHLYGLGEHFHTSFKHDLNWKTTAIHAAGKHPTGPEARNMYGVHPMYMNIEEDGKTNALLLLNQHAMDVVLQPAPAVTFRTIGGILDFYVFLSQENPGDGEDRETCTSKRCNSEIETLLKSTDAINVVELYQQAIGLPPMPPYWALGFQLCRWEYQGSDHLKQVINRNREAGIPYDVQWGDVDFMITAQSFTIDTERYEDLPEIVDDLHNHGQKCVAIHDPGIKVRPRGEYEAYDDGCDRDLWIKHNNGEILEGEVWPGICVFADYTKDDTVNWWVEHSVKFHQRLKFDGFWIDMNEPSNFIYGSTKGCENNNLNFPPYIPKITGGMLWDRTLCMDSKQHLGLHYDLHSLYGHTMINATWQATRAIFMDKRSLIVSRSTFVGSGHFAGKWLGDNKASFDDMKWSIIGMFELNMFGFPYVGADICGFFNETTEHLCQRWMQLGAFYPMSRNHNIRRTRDQDPANFGPDMIKSSRDVLLVRYSLLPYLYSLFYLAHTRGSPVIRPLAFEFSKDEKALKIDEQFMWGPAFMISPVLTNETYEVNAYFPDARWFDFFTGSELASSSRGHYTNLNTPLDKINLHVRGGFVIPTQIPDITTHKSRQNPMGLIVGLNDDMSARGFVFIDDGETMDTHLKKEMHRIVSFDATRNFIHLNTEESFGGYEVTVAMDTIRILGLLQKPDFSSFLLLADGAKTFLRGQQIVWKEETNTLTLENLNIDLNKSAHLFWEY